MRPIYGELMARNSRESKKLLESASSLVAMNAGR